MKAKFGTFVTAMALTMSAGVALAQDKHPTPAKPDAPKAPQAPQGQPQGMNPMDMLPDEMKPGKEHAEMAKHVGTWNADVTMFEGGQEMKSKGKEVVKSIFGGRFLESHFEGDMMGMPFTGHSLLGFNRTTKKYENLWIDSMSTGMMLATGTASADGKVITYAGTYDDPMTKEKVNIKQVVTLVDDNKYTFDMYKVESGGKDEKMISIVYTRAGESHTPTPVPTIKAPEIKTPDPKHTGDKKPQ